MEREKRERETAWLATVHDRMGTTPRPIAEL